MRPSLPASASSSARCWMSSCANRAVDGLAFFLREFPEALAERKDGLRVSDPLLGEMPPAPVRRLLADGADDIRLGRRRAIVMRRQRPAIALDHRLDHLRGLDARQVGTACRGLEREPQPDQVERGIADDRLVEIADLDRDFVIGIRERAEIAEMAIAADPDRRADRDLPRQSGLRQPLVELRGVAPDIGVDRARHLVRAGLFENGGPALGRDLQPCDLAAAFCALACLA